ncbi:MAG: iron ABC transporter permease [Proteobacteria bacterium]|nr:iron ABC transporter permease [Pseudomonadota bacterium]
MTSLAATADATDVAGRSRLGLAGLLLAGMVVLVGLAFAGLFVGGVQTPVRAVVDALLGTGSGPEAAILWKLRIPRELLAMLAGAGLACSGVVMQGVSRNALASPDLTGVLTGASFAIVVFYVFVPSVPAVAHPFIGLAGGLLAGGTSLVIASAGGLSPVRLALAGSAVAFFCAAGITTALVHAGPTVASVFFWLTGGLAGRGWQHLTILLPWAVAGLTACIALARPLDILALGDDAAETLGLNVRFWRIAAAITATMLSVGVVAVAGPIGFVGLCIPHIARSLVGARHAALLPASAMLGAITLLAADTMARTLAAPRELPIGVLTAIVGGPFLIHLIWRKTA